MEGAEGTYQCCFLNDINSNIIIIIIIITQYNNSSYYCIIIIARIGFLHENLRRGLLVWGNLGLFFKEIKREIFVLESVAVHRT